MSLPARFKKLAEQFPTSDIQAGERTIIMRFAALLLASLYLISFAWAADLKPPQWGEAKDGLRARLTAEKQVFPAGEPVPIKLEIENVGQQVKEYGFVSAPYWTLKVLDRDGKEVPSLVGLAQVRQNHEKLEPGKAKEIGSFDLAQAYYLRKPGRYSVQAVFEPASAPLEFEVRANPAANADGDPVGRLLPLVKKNWWLTGSGSGTIQPGKNRPQTDGRYFLLEFNPTGNKRDTGLIWVWLADKPAAEKGDDNSRLPASEYLGKIGLWHVYLAVDENSQKAWPTAKEDISKALGADAK